MPTTDPRVDAYIAKQPEFAREILTRFRAIVHDAAPEITEDIKWGHPAFMHQGLVCGIAAFKAHVAVNFWKSALIAPARARRATDDKGMQRLARLTSVADLPSRTVIAGYVKAAVKLNEGGLKAPKPAKRATRTKAPLRTPPIFAKALTRNRKAKATYDGFSPSHKREYVEWITEAKTEETRNRRIEQALGWLAEGKPRNWKYMKRR